MRAAEGKCGQTFSILIIRALLEGPVQLERRRRQRRLSGGIRAQWKNRSRIRKRSVMLDRVCRDIVVDPFLRFLAFFFFDFPIVLEERESNHGEGKFHF